MGEEGLNTINRVSRDWDEQFRGVCLGQLPIFEAVLHSRSNIKKTYHSSTIMVFVQGEKNGNYLYERMCKDDYADHSLLARGKQPQLILLNVLAPNEGERAPTLRNKIL